MAFAPKKPDAPAELPPPMAFRCQDELVFDDHQDRCRRSLVSPYVSVPLDTDNPNKVARICIECAKEMRNPTIEELQEKPEKRSLVPLWIVVGALMVLALQPGGWLWKWI